MKIISAALFCLTVLSISCFSQSRKEISKAGVKKITETDIRYENGKEVKVVLSVTSYNSSGNVVECKEYDKKAGAFKKHEKFSYNSNGDVVKIVEFDSKGNETKHTVYKYNSDGMRTLREVYEPPGKLKSKRVYQYEK